MSAASERWGFASAPSLNSIPERRQRIREAHDSIARGQAYINDEERAMGPNYGVRGELGVQEHAAGHWATGSVREYQGRLQGIARTNEQAINAAVGSPGMRAPSRHLAPAKRSR